jgi:hypothetical protein
MATATAASDKWEWTEVVKKTSVKSLTPVTSVTATVSVLSVYHMTPLCLQGTSKSKKNFTKIDHGFAGMDTRVDVGATHLNNKKINGFVTLEDAKHQIF